MNKEVRKYGGIKEDIQVYSLYWMVGELFLVPENTRKREEKAKHLSKRRSQILDMLKSKHWAGV